MRIRNIHRTQAIALAGDLPRGEPCTCGTRSSGVAEMTLTGSTQRRGSSAAGSRGHSPQASHPAPFPSHASHLCGLACSRLKSVFANESRCGAVKEELTTSFQKNKEKRPPFPDVGQDEPSSGGSWGDPHPSPSKRGREVRALLAGARAPTVSFRPVPLFTGLFWLGAARPGIPRSRARATLKHRPEQGKEGS